MAKKAERKGGGKDEDAGAAKAAKAAKKAAKALKAEREQAAERAKEARKAEKKAEEKAAKKAAKAAKAARAEAERMAEIVGGMQALVDAALAHRSLDGILRDLVAQVRGVLDADELRHLQLRGGRLIGEGTLRRAFGHEDEPEVETD